ncbi:MAG: bifunctional diaminohydroxyphosphoribosylaminopyrimidine deaminase/5-amino-6-(5-phosphoribosylamino)uracil reductase RibD [Thermodesulfobacteriota bacterium]|nr:MAG: bifunctional diaminohydroxyphosphoribosylaminopyrimidine deaminase/5-amino-6-(5-phosphoribosylamino)uracil reductase RibD [Candidatus Dadabacteria bacterium]TDJ00087.1 MAG: bifunctional diaminohydroxyphosphoribosylaminopyrimidine deaminase/5-amino-6-(5-phosphoribosylamino)uracil reductase RibD [Candidatus Dadabacteria bacterium]
MDQHSKYMSLALKLAKKAEGMTSPNPLVGAVLVKHGKIIGQGYHKKAGLPHAEIEAFKNADKKRNSLKGATLYVTLEPCCHKDKRTPPCVNTIIEKQISKVFVAMLDPNPKVSGNGIKKLRKSAIEVEVGILEEKAKELNEAFSKYITTGKPFVILKLAATMDGKIAAYTGDSKWIGSPTQRKYAHQLRNKVDGVMVGIETVLKDNPSLNVRLDKKTSYPVPIVLDSKLRIPIDSNLLSIHEHSIIATSSKSYPRKKEKLINLGATILHLKADKNGKLNLKELVKRLGKHGITSVLIEGGSKVAASALKSGIVDKVVFFYAPKIVGSEGISMIGELGISTIKKSLEIKDIKITKIKDEFMIEGYLKR